MQLSLDLDHALADIGDALAHFCYLILPLFDGERFTTTAAFDYSDGFHRLSYFLLKLLLGNAPLGSRGSSDDIYDTVLSPIQYIFSLVDLD